MNEGSMQREKKTNKQNKSHKKKLTRKILLTGGVKKKMRQRRLNRAHILQKGFMVLQNEKKKKMIKYWKDEKASHA